MSEILFECSICYETNDTMPAKYNCAECQQKTCDVCYIKHIAIDNKCIFCRSDLIIKEEDITNEILFIYKYKKIIILIGSVLLLWNIIMILYIYIHFKITVSLPNYYNNTS